MSTITLPNIRVGSDLQVRVRLKDGGVAIDWSTLQNIKACIYSDAQRALAGRCSISIDAEDPTLLVCNYAANKPQYLGANRVVISVKYLGETKTYDKPAFTFVRWTDDQAGEQITIDDPDVDVEIEVEDISSSILQEAVEAAFAGAERANEAAAAAEHMVDIHTGPEGKSAYEVAVEEGYTGTEEEWLASLVGPQGPQGIQGETGEAAGFGTTSAALTEDGGNPGVTVATSGSDTAKNFAFTFKNLKGDKGDKGDQGNSGYQGAAGELEVVNNLTDGGSTAALSAEMGKTLEGEVSQLEAETTEIGDEIGFTITNKSVGVSGLQQSKQKIDNSTGKWITVTNNERYGLWIDIVPGVTYTVVARARTAIIAILAENTFGTTGNDVQFATGFPDVIPISANGTYIFTAPLDAKGLYFQRLTNSNANSSPNSISWDEYSSERFDEIEGYIFQNVASRNVLNIYTEDTAFQQSLDAHGELQSSENYNTTGFVPIKQNTAYIASCNGYVCFYDSLKNMVGSRIQLTDSVRTFTTPTSTRYFRFSGLRNNNASWKNAYINEGATLGTYDDYVPGSSYNKIDRNVSEIEGIESILYTDGQIPFVGFTTGGYIPTASYPGDVADVANPVSRAGYKYGIIPVTKGETYIITGTGAATGRLWAFTDPAYNIVKVSSADSRVSDLELIVPIDGFLIVNFVAKYPNSVGKKVKESVIVEKETSPFYRGPFSGYGHRFATRYTGLQNEYVSRDVLGQFTTYADAITFMDGLVTAGGGYVTKTALGIAEGTDLDGNPYTIYDYAFVPASANNSDVTDKRPVVMIDACLHGFEKTAFYGWYFFLKDLVENWDKNPSLAAIRSGVEIHFIPIANPWGFDRDERPNANGINLNRNFDVPNWTETPSGSDASGAEPFDQAESAVIRDWLDAHPEAFLLIDTHTNGHYNAAGWVEANHLILVTGADDEYHNELFNIGKTYIEDNTAYFAKELNLEISPRFGQFHTNAITTTNGYIVVYGVAERKLLSVTLEGFNGLTVDEEQVVGFYGPTSQKINSEIFGNFLLNALECYVPKLPL